MAVIRQPENDPKSFLRKGRYPGTTEVVVCFGDSMTHGTVSVNYVRMLRDRFTREGLEFVNAGINGQLAYNLLQRVDEVIATEPDVVIMLVGTNDINATLTDTLRDTYLRDRDLPEPPSHENFIQHMSDLVSRLSEETDARIALMSPPVLGEDPQSIANQRVAEYSATLRQIAETEDAAYLPLYETQIEALQTRDTSIPPGYEGDLKLLYNAAQQHYMQGKSWDQFSEEQGFMFLIDNIHLNTRGATMVADLIGGYLNQ